MASLRIFFDAPLKPTICFLSFQEPARRLSDEGEDALALGRASQLLLLRSRDRSRDRRNDAKNRRISFDFSSA